uniref:V-SNARE coiled-coil homology domain-containing protein n=1 Tax=Syphacia muris TaxID=451379 RepID=A0A0N5AMX4_9BILA
MEENRQDEQSARMSQLQQQVSQVKTVMSNNVQRILERGDRLENLESRTDALTASSENFKISARRVQRHMCRQNAKWTIIVSVGTILIVIIIILLILNGLGVFGNN